MDADQLHQLTNGRWIFAQWQQETGQWTTNDVSREFIRNFSRGGGCYRYSFARTLDRLGAVGGVRTYATREAALRQLAPPPQDPISEQIEANERARGQHPDQYRHRWY